MKAPTVVWPEVCPTRTSSWMPGARPSGTVNVSLTLPSGPATTLPTSTEFEWTVALTVSPGVNPVDVAVPVAPCFTAVGVTTADSGRTSEHEGENAVVRSVAGVPFVLVVSVATNGVPTDCRGTVATRVPDALNVSVWRSVRPSGELPQSAAW